MDSEMVGRTKSGRHVLGVRGSKFRLSKMQREAKKTQFPSQGLEA